MAHLMVKPYSFLLYFLTLITFFFIGLTYAGIVEAGKNQGLAGGAIVFGYGVIAAGIGLLISLFIAYKTNRKLIFRLNIILAISIASFYLYYHLKYLERQKAKEQEQQKTEQPKQPTQSVDSPLETKPTAMLYTNEKHLQTNKTSSLGMFSPNMYENKTLYFYGNLNLEKSLMDHSPNDSITFKRKEHGGFNIATAPPYLVPDHLKLDYDMLYFKVVSVTEEFLEVVVNTTSQQTAFVSKRAGTLQYWPDFLLGIHSVEFINPETQKVFVKPLSHAGIVNTSCSFMRPLKVKQDWMYVLLLNDSFDTVGKGWIKWIKDGKLLITYSLLS